MKHVYTGWANAGKLWFVTVDRDGKCPKRPLRKVELYTMLLPFFGRRVRVVIEDMDSEREAQGSGVSERRHGHDCGES